MTKAPAFYARLLAEEVGKDSALPDAVLEFGTAVEALQTSEIRNFFITAPVEEKIELIDSVLKKIISEEVLNVLKLAVLHGQFRQLPVIARRFAAISAEKSGTVQARVESATELSGVAEKELKASLEKMSGKKIRLKNEINEELLGGVRVYLGDTLIDLSLSGKLKKLSSSLTN